MGDNLPNYDIDKGEKCLEIYSEPNDIIVNINETNEGFLLLYFISYYKLY